MIGLSAESHSVCLNQKMQNRFSGQRATGIPCQLVALNIIENTTIYDHTVSVFCECLKRFRMAHMFQAY